MLLAAATVEDKMHQISKAKSEMNQVEGIRQRYFALNNLVTSHKNSLSRALNTVVNKIEQALHNLTTQIEEKLNEADINYSELKEAQNLLEDAAKMALVIGILDMFGGLLSGAGPIGQIAAGAVGIVSDQLRICPPSIPTTEFIGPTGTIGIEKLKTHRHHQEIKPPTRLIDRKNAKKNPPSQDYAKDVQDDVEKMKRAGLWNSAAVGIATVRRLLQHGLDLAKNQELHQNKIKQIEQSQKELKDFIGKLHEKQGNLASSMVSVLNQLNQIISNVTRDNNSFQQGLIEIENNFSDVKLTLSQFTQNLSDFLTGFDDLKVSVLSTISTLNTIIDNIFTFYRSLESEKTTTQILSVILSSGSWLKTMHPELLSIEESYYSCISHFQRQLLLRSFNIWDLSGTYSEYLKLLDNSQPLAVVVEKLKHSYTASTLSISNSNQKFAWMEEASVHPVFQYRFSDLEKDQLNRGERVWMTISQGIVMESCQLPSLESLSHLRMKDISFSVNPEGCNGVEYVIGFRRLDYGLIEEDKDEIVLKQVPFVPPVAFVFSGTAVDQQLASINKGGKYLLSPMGHWFLEMKGGQREYAAAPSKLLCSARLSWRTRK
ncbi:hypothetical protein HDU79_006793 [Rhizoclosmatium sp. JEL0117]|nr:hypothetical protein HDU79_006793 [Rhizoclosmatium sp. JEL0117]